MPAEGGSARATFGADCMAPRRRRRHECAGGGSRTARTGSVGTQSLDVVPRTPAMGEGSPSPSTVGDRALSGHAEDTAWPLSSRERAGHGLGDDAIIRLLD